MPLTWTISHPNRLVTAIGKDQVSLLDMQAYLDGVAVADAMGYAKIFDLSNGCKHLCSFDWYRGFRYVGNFNQR